MMQKRCPAIFRRIVNLAQAGSAAAALQACASAPSTIAATPVDIEPIVKSSSPNSLKRAEAASEAGAWAEAIAGYRTVLSNAPDDATARFGLAEALRRSGATDEAIGEYLKIVSDDAYRIGALEGLGFAYLASGDEASAGESFDIALAEDPRAWRAGLGKAQIADFQRDWLAADVAYEAALLATEEAALVLNNYGVSKLARNEARAAENLFRRALEIDPSFERARINLELAAAVINPTIDAQGENADPRKRAQRLNNRGYVAMLQRRFGEAEALFRQAIETHPAFYAAAYENLQILKALEARGRR